jgi:hypothetical protein
VSSVRVHFLVLFHSRVCDSVRVSVSVPVHVHLFADVYVPVHVISACKRIVPAGGAIQQDLILQKGHIVAILKGGAHTVGSNLSGGPTA